MRKSIIILLVLLLLSLFIFGCSTAEDGQPTVSEPQVKESITVAIAAEPNTLDPQQSAVVFDIEVFNNLFDSLVRLDENNEIIPSLAESWNISDDDMLYTFQLRQGVKFHNGEELTADDVVFTFERGRESPFLATYYDNIGNVSKVDEYTVAIELAEPFAPLIRVLAMPLFAILNEKAVEEAGSDFETSPVGTGPYSFTSWDFGNSITLTRFDDYFRGPAAIKDVAFRFIGDPNTSLAALEAGEVDYTYHFPAIAISSIENNPNLSLMRIESVQLHMIFINNIVEPFDNVAVRQAINYAVNRDEILNVAAEGEGVVTDIPVNRNTFGYTEKIQGYAYNPDKAKEILIESGYQDGFSASIIASDDADRKVAEAAQFQLSNVGINLEVDMMEINTAIDYMLSGNYEMGVLSFENIMLDADFISLIFDSKLADGGFNIANYNSQVADDLFKKARMETDEFKRLQLYEEAFQVLVDDAVFVPLYFSYNLIGSNSSLDVDYISASSLTAVYNMSWK